MIKNIIFDLGNIFIDLNEEKSKKELLNLGLEKFSDDMLAVNSKYEKGEISSSKFLEFYKNKFPDASKETLIASWNSILLDFPKRRLKFLEGIPNKYRLFLLSNTNSLHLDYFKSQVGYDFYCRFVNCFEKTYYSFEINRCKPDKEVFQFIVDENNLNISETLFIDDKLENIKPASSLGMHTWHLNPKKNEVVTLFKTKADLFNKKDMGHCNY